MARTKRRIILFQPRIPGVRREPLPSCVLGAIHRAVETDAARHGVSRSWVIAVILANHYRIEGQALYDK